MLPVLLACLGIQAVQETFQLGNIDQAAVDSAGADGPPEYEGTFGPFGSQAAVVPDDAGVGVLLGIHSGRVLLGDLGIVIDNQFLREVAGLGDFHAPAMTHAVLVLAI